MPIPWQGRNAETIWRKQVQITGIVCQEKTAIQLRVFCCNVWRGSSGFCVRHSSDWEVDTIPPHWRDGESTRHNNTLYECDFQETFPTISVIYGLQTRVTFWHLFVWFQTRSPKSKIKCSHFIENLDLNRLVRRFAFGEWKVASVFHRMVLVGWESWTNVHLSVLTFHFMNWPASRWLFSSSVHGKNITWRF